MENIVAIVGIIGGILAAVGLFGTWTTTSMLGVEVSASGWELTRGWKMTVPGVGTLDIPGIRLPWLVLVGGVLAVVGGVTAVVKPSMVPKLLLAIGGILALIGVAGGLTAIEAPAVAGVVTRAGYGTYLVTIGGILAILTALGVKEAE